MRGMKKKEKMARNVFPSFDTDKSQLGCFVLKNILILLSFSHCFEMLYFFLAFLIKLSCAPSGRHGNLTGLEGEYLNIYMWQSLLKFHAMWMNLVVPTRNSQLKRKNKQRKMEKENNDVFVISKIQFIINGTRYIISMFGK